MVLDRPRRLTATDRGEQRDGSSCGLWTCMAVLHDFKEIKQRYYQSDVPAMAKFLAALIYKEGAVESSAP